MTITTIFGWICWINIAWIFYIYQDVEDICGFPRIMIYKCWSFHMELIVYPRVHMNVRCKIQKKWRFSGEKGKFVFHFTEDSKKMEDKSTWDLENCSERCPSWSVKDAEIWVKCAGESMMNEFILCGFRLYHPNHGNPHGKQVHTKHVLLQEQRGRSLVYHLLYHDLPIFIFVAT